MAVSNKQVEKDHFPELCVVDDVACRDLRGVQTLEGRIGLLFLTSNVQCHFIEFPSGTYIEEHAHPKGSIIFVVRGRCVLSSRGKRRVLKAHSCFVFEDNVPIGFEVPFDEGALILIFKWSRLAEDEEGFYRYVEEMALRLEDMRRNGTKFTLRELPEDHPAAIFAKNDSQRQSVICAWPFGKRRRYI
jgi:quercetin dioxygenase-like cupin family protein